jgi:hypothetical protein
LDEIGSPVEEFASEEINCRQPRVDLFFADVRCEAKPSATSIEDHVTAMSLGHAYYEITN